MILKLKVTIINFIKNTIIQAQKITMKLLLADDHALFQEGFSMIIKSKIIESKVITASNWREAFLQVEAQDIDVALLDLFMPGTKPWQARYPLR